MASQIPPKKGTAFSLALNLYTTAGQVVANPSTLTAQTSKDFGAYAAASSASVISTVYGLVKVVLDSTQMNGDVINVYVRDESTATVPFTMTLFTAKHTLDASLGVMAAGTGTQSSSNTFTVASTETFNTNDPAGATLWLPGQARTILSYDSTSKIATVDAWGTLPSSVAPYTIFATPPASDLSVPSVRVVEMDTNVLSSAVVSSGAVVKMTASVALAADLSTLASALSSIAGGSTLTASEAAAAVMGSTADGYTVTEILRGLGSILLSKVSGSSGSTTVFRDMQDTKNRVTAVTDTSGNRSIVTLDLT